MTEEFVKKKCKDCKAEYEGTPKSRFCLKCRQRREYEGQRRKRQEIKDTLGYRKALKSEKKKSIQVVHRNVTQCKKCLYRLYITEKDVACGYLYYTDKMRPCEPSPNCTAFKKTNRQERKELMDRVSTPPSPVPSRSKRERQYAEYTAEVIAREEKNTRRHKKG